MAFHNSRYELRLPHPQDDDAEREVAMSRVDEFIQGGYQQVSRRYRLIARLPSGKTGLEALAEVNPELAKHFLAQANEQAARQYLARHADGENKVELTDDEFREYLGKTGRAPVL